MSCKSSRIALGVMSLVALVVAHPCRAEVSIQQMDGQPNTVLTWTAATTAEVFKAAADKAGYEVVFDPQALNQHIADSEIVGESPLDTLNILLEQATYKLEGDESHPIIHVNIMNGYSLAASSAEPTANQALDARRFSDFKPRAPSTVGPNTPATVRAAIPIQAERAAQQNAVFLQRLYKQQ